MPERVFLRDAVDCNYTSSMIPIRFSNVELKRRAIGALAGRFTFKSWATGEMIVPESALAFLTVEGIAFTVEGPATHEQNTPAFLRPISNYEGCNDAQ